MNISNNNLQVSYNYIDVIQYDGSIFSKFEKIEELFTFNTSFFTNNLNNTSTINLIGYNLFMKINKLLPFFNLFNNDFLELLEDTLFNITKRYVQIDYTMNFFVYNHIKQLYNYNSSSVFFNI